MRSAIALKYALNAVMLYCKKFWNSKFLLIFTQTLIILTTWCCELISFNVIGSTLQFPFSSRTINCVSYLISFTRSMSFSWFKWNSQSPALSFISQAQFFCLYLEFAPHAASVVFGVYRLHPRTTTVSTCIYCIHIWLQTKTEFYTTFSHAHCDFIDC